jgi:exopolysaccharide biosynthesis polyprenyl glycosylphosphotransferase
MIRLFRVFIPASVLALLFSDAAILLFSFVVACYLVLDVDPSIFLLSEGGLERITLVALSIMLGLYFNDLYTRLRIRSRVELIQQFCLATGAAFLIQAFVSYVNRDWMLPRAIMISGCLMSLIAVPAWRIFYSVFAARLFGMDKVLYLGCSPVVQQIANTLSEHPELGFLSLGCVSDGMCVHSNGLQHLGEIRDLRRVVEELKPDRVVVGLSDPSEKFPTSDLLALRLSGVPIEEVGKLYEVAYSRVCTQELRAAQLIFSDSLGPSRGPVLLRDTYSLVIAFLGVVISFPLLVLVGILVKVSSKGPILYRQTRVGLNGVPFVLYKFRSMREDAEVASGAVWAVKDDPRVTVLGKWLRKLRLDELPQLFNVLRGEMAVVGPRPERPEFVKTLTEQIPFYQQRHCVKPGITGWAQINHKYGDTVEDTVTKLEYDLYYIKNISPSLDSYIVFHTLKVMLLVRGAQ